MHIFKYTSKASTFNLIDYIGISSEWTIETKTTTAQHNTTQSIPSQPQHITHNMSDTGLPQGWEIRLSNTRNLPYYFHAESSTSAWEPPAGSDVDKLKEYLQKKYPAQAAVASAAAEAAINPDSENGGEKTIRCSHLLIKHKDSRRPSSWKEDKITRTKEEALSIILGHEARIRSGAATLSELATTESDCSSARKGGDLGRFSHGMMQKEFSDAAFQLQPGEMSRVVESSSGYHLIERTA